MTTALITGVAGQDGRYLSRVLLEQGVEVHGTVRPGTSAPDGVIAHDVDLVADGAAADLVREVRPDQVFNLAALSSVARSWEEPLLTARINGELVAELLDALTDVPGATFVQASSAEIFGEPARAPQDESTPIRPINPYGAAKAYAHHLVGAYRAAGHPAASLILYNHESPLRPERFVTRKITAAAARMAKGSDETLHLGALDARRDWGWAPDFAEAMRLAAQQPDDYVIATGVAHSVDEFAAAAFARAGIHDWRGRVVIDDTLRRPVDAAEQVGDASKAAAVLGWRPTKSFEEIVAAMVDADLGRA